MSPVGVLKIDDPAQFVGKITNFGVGNLIDLVGLGDLIGDEALPAHATLGANGVLTLTGGNVTDTLNIGSAAAYADDTFILYGDGHMGVDVAVVPDASKVITFSELPVGTTITNQYQKDGVIFTSNPSIEDNSYDPTSPALAGSADFNGPIAGYFCNPSNGQHATVEEFQFDAGYFNNLHSTEIEWFRTNGQTLGKQYDQVYAYQHFSISSTSPIASFKIFEVGAEASGYSLDNLAVGPTTTLNAVTLYEKR